MKSCRYSYEVELFAVTDGALVLDGWLTSEAAIEAVRLLVPDRVMAVEMDAPSERRRLRLRDDPDIAGLDRAEIEVVATNGDRLVWRVGDLFRPAGWMPEIAAVGGLGAHDAAGLAAALEDNFAALDDEADLFMHHETQGWAATSHRYGFVIAAAPELDRDQARKAVAAQAREAALAFAASFDEGVPMLVHRQRETDGEDAMGWLFAAMRARNPQAILLWVDPRRDDGPVVRHRDAALGPPEMDLLIGSERTEPAVLVRRARDVLVTPR